MFMRMNSTQAKAQADILKAIAHPTRVLMLDALSRGDRCVNELRIHASVSQPTISHHLEKLKKVGIVTEQRVGKKIVHHLASPCILKALVCTVEALKSVNKRLGKTL